MRSKRCLNHAPLLWIENSKPLDLFLLISSCAMIGDLDTRNRKTWRHLVVPAQVYHFHFQDREVLLRWFPKRWFRISNLRDVCVLLCWWLVHPFALREISKSNNFKDEALEPMEMSLSNSWDWNFINFFKAYLKWLQLKLSSGFLIQGSFMGQFGKARHLFHESTGWSPGTHNVGAEQLCLQSGPAYPDIAGGVHVRLAEMVGSDC